MKRRDFVHASLGSAFAVSLPNARRIGSSVFSPRQARPTPEGTSLRDPRARALALSAVEAARSAGARYADVRLTNTMERSIGDFNRSGPVQSVDLGLSVRALVNGYWGWAATPTLSTDEAVRVARLATRLATMTATRAKPNAVELGTIPIVHDEEWATPVRIDPFTLGLLDVHEWVFGLGRHLLDLGTSRGTGRSRVWMTDAQRHQIFSVRMQKQERVLASTEGTLVTQTVVTIEPALLVPYRTGSVTIPHFNLPVQAGWEYIADTPIIDLIIKEMEKADASPPQPPIKHVDVGRYDIVFSAAAMAELMSKTFGAATELDRVLGYEANATGGSYLGPDPLARLGTQVASPLVSITAERSNPRGLATVKWDDEGVVPEEFPLVRNGRLMNYQTTRAQATWLAPWYEKQGRSVSSLGCAMAPTALEETMQHTPNLVLQPSAGTATEESMVQELEHGLHVAANLNLTMDWMCANGYSFTAAATEIRRGKPVSTFGVSGLMFNTNEFWKNVMQLGGRGSAAYMGSSTFPQLVSRKGDPMQQTVYSVGAVPARVNGVAVVDPWKKA